MLSLDPLTVPATILSTDRPRLARPEPDPRRPSRRRPTEGAHTHDPLRAAPHSRRAHLRASIHQVLTLPPASDQTLARANLIPTECALPLVAPTGTRTSPTKANAPGTRDSAIPYAGSRKRHKDVAATNALVQAMESPAFEALTVSVARARAAHEGRGGSLAVAAAEDHNRASGDEWVLMPKMKIPMEYVRKLRDVDELEKRIERDERVERARRGVRSPVDHGTGQQQIELMFAADVKRGSRPSTAALANEHRRVGPPTRRKAIGKPMSRLREMSQAESTQESVTSPISSSTLRQIDAQSGPRSQVHQSQPDEQASVARIPMHIPNLSADFDSPTLASHHRIAHFQETSPDPDNDPDEVPLSSSSSTSPSRIHSHDSLGSFPQHQRHNPAPPPPLPVHECLSAAARKVLRRITAASTTGQRSGTTRQGAVSPGFLLDESLTLSRTSTPAPNAKAKGMVAAEIEQDASSSTPANTNNGNSSGNPVDGEIVRVLCGTTTAELDQLLSSTHHGGRHLSTRKRTPSASLPTSRSASATTSLTRFDVNVLLDGRESQGLVRILTGSHASGPDHGRNKHEDSLDDVASRAAVVATPLADANRRKNINRIIRAPVKITEKWHASKVMLESLVGAAASGGSVSVSSSSLALAPGQVGRTSMAKQSVVHLAGAEVIEEDGETDEVTGTRSQSALNSASTVTAAPHRAPSPSLATVHDLSTSQMASLEDLTFDSRPLPPLNPSVDPPTSHKHHANNRPSRSRPTVVPPPAVVVDKSAVPIARSRAESILTAPEALDRPLRNHTPGSVYVIDRPARPIHALPSTTTSAGSGGLRAVANAVKKQQAETEGESWSLASSTVASLADLATASHAARRRSVVHEFGAGAAVVAAVKAAAKAAEAVVRLGYIEGDEGDDDDGGWKSRRTSDATGSFKRLQQKNALIGPDHEFPAKYCIEASAFMATVKSMGAKYRTGNLPNFPTSLTLDEIANTIHRLELTALPVTLPSTPRGGSTHAHLPRSLTDPLEWALALNYPPLAQNAARLAWIASKGHIPPQIIPQCQIVFFDMLCNNTVTDQRLAAAALSHLGHQTDSRMVAFLARQLGEVDKRARQVAIEALSSAEPERMHDVLQVVYPLLVHSNPAVRSDAVMVVAQVAATWREKYPNEYRKNVVGEPKLVVPDGGDKYDAVVAVGQQQQQQAGKESGSLDSVSATDEETGSSSDGSDSDGCLAPVSLTKEEEQLRDCLVRIVIMMISDWDLSLRDQCSQVVAEFDLVPLLLNHASGLLRDAGLGGRQMALKIMSIIKMVTVDMWEPFLEVFGDDYASVRAEACLTAHAIGLSHSKLVKELLNKLTDSEPNVRACSVKALSTVATGPKIAFEIFNLLLNFLDHELMSQVKESGCDTIVVFVNACDEHVRTFAATGMGSTGTGATSTMSGNGNPPGPTAVSNHLAPNSTLPVAPGSPRMQRSRPGSSIGNQLGESLAAGSTVTASNPRLATSAANVAAKTASPHGSSVNVAADPQLSPNGTGGEPKTAVQRAASLGERARALLIKWYTRGHRDELRLQECAERALVALGVHVASLAVSDSGLSGDAEVCEVVAAETREELRRVREKYYKGQVTECALGNVETALALATLQPSLASSAAAADGDTPANVVSRRIKQLGTRANVLRQLSLMDKLESHQYPGSLYGHDLTNAKRQSAPSSAVASESALNEQRHPHTRLDADMVWKMMTEGPQGSDVRGGKNASFVLEEDEVDPDELPDTVDVTLGGVIDGLPLSGPRQTMGTALNSRRQSLLAMAPITAALTSSRPSTSGSESLSSSSHSLATSRRGSLMLAAGSHSRAGDGATLRKPVGRRDSVVMRRMFSR